MLSLTPAWKLSRINNWGLGKWMTTNKIPTDGLKGKQFVKKIQTRRIRNEERNKKFVDDLAPNWEDIIVWLSSPQHVSLTSNPVFVSWQAGKCKWKHISSGFFLSAFHSPHSNRLCLSISSQQAEHKEEKVGLIYFWRMYSETPHYAHHTFFLALLPSPTPACLPSSKTN